MTPSTFTSTTTLSVMRSSCTMTSPISTMTTGLSPLLSLDATHGPYISMTTTKVRPCVCIPVTPTNVIQASTPILSHLAFLQNRCPVPDVVAMPRPKSYQKIMEQDQSRMELLDFSTQESEAVF